MPGALRVSALLAGRLFRAGTPSHASLADVLLLRKTLGMQHLIDFR